MSGDLSQTEAMLEAVADKIMPAVEAAIRAHTAGLSPEAVRSVRFRIMERILLVVGRDFGL